jgi:hypothetical protein
LAGAFDLWTEAIKDVSHADGPCRGCEDHIQKVEVLFRHRAHEQGNIGQANLGEAIGFEHMMKSAQHLRNLRSAN